MDPEQMSAGDESLRTGDLPHPERVLAAEGLLTPSEPESEEVDWIRQSDILHGELVKTLLNVVSTLADGLRDDIEARRKLYRPAFVLVSTWLAAILVLLFLRGQVLPEGVLLALVGSVTLGIIGLLATIMSYYYTGKDMVRQVMHTYFTKVLDA